MGPPGDGSGPDPVASRVGVTTRPEIAAIDAEQRRLRRAADRALSEREWQAQVVKAAEAFGWAVWYDTDSRRNRAGWPDLTLLRVRGGQGRLLFLELKTERGRVRPEQREWLDALSAVPGVVATVVRPRDWDDVLALLSAPPSPGRGDEL